VPAVVGDPKLSAPPVPLTVVSAEPLNINWYVIPVLLPVSPIGTPVDAPVHIAPPPEVGVIGNTAGADNTVTFVDVAQPAGNVYVIVALPGKSADTIPELTVATDASLLVHAPPDAVSVSVVVPY